MPSSRTFKAVPPSGTSKRTLVPRLLSYPKLLPFETTPAINDVYCYVLEHYGTKGISVLVYRQPEMDQVTVLCGDWEGEAFDLTESTELTELSLGFLRDSSEKLINFMHTIKLQQAQYFFAITDAGLILADVQIAINKLVGPGMVDEVFGKILPTPKIRKIELLDARAREALLTGTGSYVGDLILKPNKYQDFHDQPSNTYQPLYAEVRR